MKWQDQAGFRQERRRRIRELRDGGATNKQIARTFARDYDESPLKAFRWAHDWSLVEACERFHNDVADDPEHGSMSPPRLSLYENWPRSANPECRPPSVRLLQAFAKLYQCSPSDLIEGTDYTPEAERTQQHGPMTSPSDPAPEPVGEGDGTSEAEQGLLPDSVLAEAVVEARRRGGRELSRLRGRAGLSQQDLANRVGYTRGQVAGAEVGSQSTAPEFWQACDRVLAAGGALVAARAEVGAAMRARRDAAIRREEGRREARLQQWRAERELALPSTQDWESWSALVESDVALGRLDSGRISGTTDWTAEDTGEGRGIPSHRRHVVKLGGTFTLASLLELLSVEPDRMNEALDGGTVSDDRIARFESVADRLGLQAVKVVPTALLGDAVVNFRSVRRLAQQKQTTNRQIRLQRIGAKLGIVVGEILFIEGHFDLARHWYRTAQHAASEAGDRFLADIALASEAYLPTYSDDPQGVLSLVTPRLEQRAYPTPAIAWLWAFKAKAHAQLGERAGFEEAIAQAHTAMTKSKREQVCPGIYSFLPEKLAFYEATGYVKLHDVGGAVSATDRALELYDLTDTTEPALVRFNKASALAASGEIPEACNVAAGALLGEYTYPSVSVLTAARDFDRLLGRDTSVPVREWREALVTVRREPVRMALPMPEA
ncbi:MAG TPA: helix-turn-helix transcriptional regulator [Actinomycetes bacterium]|nr:helix-turn-helix transcriptional regulator [Actinomycetes bacterium]